MQRRTQGGGVAGEAGDRAHRDPYAIDPDRGHWARDYGDLVELTGQLKAPKTFSLFVAVSYQEDDWCGVLSIAEYFHLRAAIDFGGAGMRHVLIVHQQSGNGAARDGELRTIHAWRSNLWNLGGSVEQSTTHVPEWK
jgi:hypothetical protein